MNLKCLLVLMAGLITIGIGQSSLYIIFAPISKQLGIGEVHIGAIISSTALILTFASPFWGRLIDKLGYKKIFLVGLMSYSLGSATFAYILYLGTQNKISGLAIFICLLAIRVAYGFMTAGINPSALAYVTSKSEDHKKNANVGLVSSCFGIGAMIGPVISSVLSGENILLPILVASFLAALASISGFFVISETTHKPEVKTNKTNRVKLKFTETRILFWLLSILCAYVAYSCFQQTLALSIQNIYSLSTNDAVKQAGIAFTLLAISTVCTEVIIIRMIKLNPNQMIYLGGTLILIGFMLLTTPPNIKITLLSQVFIGSGFGFLFPGLQLKTTAAVEIEEQGSISGLIFGAASFGYVLGPIIGMSMIDKYHYAPFIICLIFIITCLILTSIYKLKFQKSTNKAINLI